MKPTTPHNSLLALVILVFTYVVTSQPSSAVVYTNGFSSGFDTTSRDAHILGGATPTLSFEEFFGPLNGVNIGSGTLNFVDTPFGRGAGVWLDSSSWGAGATIQVSFDISGFTDGDGNSRQSYFQAYEGLGVDTSNSVGIDIHNGGHPQTSSTGSASIAKIGAQGNITGDGTLVFNFVHDGAGATAFVFNNVNGGGTTSNQFSLDNLIIAIPEPSSSALLGLGILGVLLRRWR